MKKFYNSDGSPIEEGKWFLPLSREYFDANGIPLWGEYIKFGDKCGFDIRYEAADGHYLKERSSRLGKKS